MKALDFLLQQEDTTIAQVKDRAKNNYANKRWGSSLTELQITSGAYEKAFAYARIACEVSKNMGTEIVGYLVSPKEANDRIARDCYLIDGQLAGSGEIRIGPQDIIAAGREIDKLGYRVLGWWHSHGDLETFHSQIDAENQMTVLNAIAPVNYSIERAERKLENLQVEKNGKQVVAYEKRNPGIKYRFTTDKNSGLALASMEIEMEKRIGFAYSLVVHGPKLKTRVEIKREIDPAKKTDFFDFEFTRKAPIGFGKGNFNYAPRFIEELVDREQRPYAEIATRISCDSCNEVTESSREVGIQLLDKDKIVIDEDELALEVADKVRFKRPFGMQNSHGYPESFFDDNLVFDPTNGGKLK